MSRRDEEIVGVGQPLVRLPGVFPTVYPTPIPLPGGAPSPSSILNPGTALRVRPGPKKTWWWLQAFSIKCPNCPKTVLATIGPYSMSFDQFVTLAANYQKGGVQLQVRRQRRADEPDPGAWYYTMIPGGSIAMLEKLSGSKV